MGLLNPATNLLRQAGEACRGGAVLVLVPSGPVDFGRIWQQAIRSAFQDMPVFGLGTGRHPPLGITTLSESADEVFAALRMNTASPAEVKLKVKPENLDTEILRILHSYFEQHPGEPRMMYNELLRITEAEPTDVIQCLYGLREKKWTEFDLTEGAETGLVWLTQIGIRIAGDIH
ncbi:hypothetical protein QUF72_09745 [Desulfobacterales bacterium HSG2]|nr:hypothetical protein [Desulfobacterales bacterium HSG2]